MRSLVFAFLLLAPVALAIPGSPVVAGVGPVTFDNGCFAVATVEIEATTKAVSTYPLYGTGVVHFTSECWLLYAHPFVGGQSLEWGLGNCRVFADGAGECWIGYGWDYEQPHPEKDPYGVYMRLDADGAFTYAGFDDRATGTLVRV